MGRPMKLELTRVGLLVLLGNRYTTRGALFLYVYIGVSFFTYIYPGGVRGVVDNIVENGHGIYELKSWPGLFAIPIVFDKGMNQIIFLSAMGK